ARCFYGEDSQVYLGNDIELPAMGSIELHHLVNGHKLELPDCSLAATAARQHAFIMPATGTPGSFRPGMLVNTQGYRDFMRGAALHLGVRALQAPVVEVRRHDSTGYIASLV